MGFITLAQIGLFIDIVGVVLLFMYGLPSKYAKNNRMVWAGDISDSQKRLNKRVKIGSYSGLFFLFIGFVLQFISPYCTN